MHWKSKPVGCCPADDCASPDTQTRAHQIKRPLAQHPTHSKEMRKSEETELGH